MSSIWRLISYSMACLMKRKEFMFFSSQRVPKGSPGRRTETLASQRNWPFSMSAPETSRKRTSWCSCLR